jgi:hypothetical protein
MMRLLYIKPAGRVVRPGKHIQAWSRFAVLNFQIYGNMVFVLPILENWTLTGIQTSLYIENLATN